MIPHLQSDQTQLLIIDVQGKLADIVVDSELLLHNTQTLIQAAELLQIPIVWVEQNPQGLGPTHMRLKTLLETNHTVLTKHTFSAWQNIKIQQQIMANNRNQILVSGIEAHVCVYQTVMDLLRNDLEVHVAVDALSSRKVYSKELGINKMCGFGAVATTTEMALFELMQTHKHPHFKEILRMIK